MKFVVIGESSGATMDQLMAVYPRHKALVDQFIARGEVIGIGPFESRGNMAIFRTREAAEAFVRQDPFALEGLVKSYAIHGWSDALLPESTISKEQAAPETKGVSVSLLSTVDLGPEIEGMAGRQLRMRMVTMEPGSVFGPMHDHKGRPGIVYILQGTITDHRNGVATDYGPGVGWPEDRNTMHWLENRGTVPAVEISVDIVKQG